MDWRRCFWRENAVRRGPLNRSAVPPPRKLKHPFIRMDIRQDPFPVNPRPDFFEFPEIDFRVKVGGKIFPVAAGVDVQNVNGVDGVEMMFHRQRAPRVHNARVKPDAQNGVNAFFLASVPPFPFVVGIPWADPRTLWPDLREWRCPCK
jgi:hypothetical protein